MVIYASFIVGVWLGRRLAGTQSSLKIAAFTLLTSLQFFVITSFASWLWFQSYPKRPWGSDVLRCSGPVFRLDPCR
jgi:hypothetical protein